MNAIGGLPLRFRPAAAWLKDFARSTPGVVAAYLGGSLATDRVDADSDLDCQVLVEAGRAQDVFDAMLGGLRERWTVDGLWLVPTPAWHGGIQLFATVAPSEAVDRPTGGSVEPLWVDLLVAEATPGWLDVDERRHGRVVVLHDPGDQVRFVPQDDERLRKDAVESAQRIADRLATAEWLVMKAVRRGHWPEAYDYLVRMGVVPVVQLLRTVHCPARWDFGLRYLDDLPADDVARVQRLLPGPPEHLGVQAEEAFAWQRDLLARVLR